MKSRKLKSSHLKTVLFVKQPVSSKVTFTNLALFFLNTPVLAKRKNSGRKNPPPKVQIIIFFTTRNKFSHFMLYL